MERRVWIHGRLHHIGCSFSQDNYSANRTKSERLSGSNNRKVLWHQQPLSHSSVSSQSISPDIHYSNNKMWEHICILWQFLNEASSDWLMAGWAYMLCTEEVFHLVLYHKDVQVISHRTFTVNMLQNTLQSFVLGFFLWSKTQPSRTEDAF